MPRIRTAHKFSEQQRTNDVLTGEFVEFKSLLLSSDVLKGLSSSGFERPSPIQLKAIPLGRCGLDLIAQAKSGTGKTCVFSVIALESLSVDNNATQVLILAPTREIAVQIKDVITAIGSHMDSLVCHVFIGGLPVEDDKKLLKKSCHIAVGTPGRIKFLIENHFLRTESVRLFILDEADKLLEDNFQEQINWIFSSLPSNKQMMAFSATYPEYLAKHLTQYMREPTFVRLNATDPTLQGIKQFYQLVPFHPLPHKTFQEKVIKLLKLLSSVQFHQCLVFSNYQIRAQSLCDTLCSKGWPSVFIAGSQTQAQRLKAMEKLKEFKCRVLISTDLTSRGIDAEHVNLVVNMDVPRDSETYLHRIGRAGRFGTKGVAVTFVAQGEEGKLFKTMEENIGITIDTLPDPIPQSLCTSEASSGLASRSVQSRTGVVEVDMLKNSSIGVSQDKVHHDNPKSTSVQTSSGCADEVLVDAGKMVCYGEQRSCVGDLMKQGCLENGSENTKAQTNLLPNVWGKSGIDLLLTNNETEKQVMAAIQNKPMHAAFSHCNQNLKESFNGPKELQKARSSCDMPLPCRNQTDDVAAVTLQDAFEVDLQCDLMKRGDIETAEKQSSPHVSSTDLESSLSFGEENDHLVNKLHCLKLDSHPDVRSINTRFNPYFLTDTSSGKLGVENKHVDNGLQASAADKRKSSESLSGEESLQDDESEHGDTTEKFSGLEADSHSMSEEECNIIYQLPSVEEFERDFAEYLENVPNLVNFVESSPNSSELEDELEEDDIQSEDELDATETNSESFNETSADVLQSMPSHIEHCVSNDKFTCKRNHYDQLTQCQTDKCCSGHCGKSFSAVNSSHLYPYVHYNEWHGHDSTYSNHHHDHYYHYNYLYQGASTTYCFANGQRQPFPSSSQCQYSGQSYIDHQDYLWKVSWYNSYHKQTNSIRQFVAFSRGGIKF